MTASAAPLPMPLSVNTLAAPLVERLLREADALRVAVRRDDAGVRIVDAGIDGAGSVAAGLLIGEICMGGLGARAPARRRRSDGWPTWLEVHSSQPVLACLGSQYAGWSLAASKEETGGKKFFALGSGPARALAGKETLFAELGYRDRADTRRAGARGRPRAAAGRHRQAAARLRARARGADADPDADHQPGRHDAGRGARARGGAAQGARARLRARATSSTAAASAPLPAPSPDGVQAMGRTNDAILYGGRVHLTRARRRRRGARRWRSSCRRATRATTAARSPRSSRTPATTSTRSTARCSRRPRCGSATSTAATPGTPARSTWRCCSGLWLAGGLMRRMRVAIMTDETGWHTRQLQARAARARRERPLRRPGRLPHRHRRPPGTASCIPGFGRELPDAVLVRGIAGGSFEQVTKRLGVLHALREFGVPVYNDARAIERSVDKSMTSLLLHAAGIADAADLGHRIGGAGAAHRDARERGRPRAGAQAAVRLAGQGPAAGRPGRRRAPCRCRRSTAPTAALAYLQRFVPPARAPGFDWRVLVIGGRARRRDAARQRALDPQRRAGRALRAAPS